MSQPLPVASEAEEVLLIVAHRLFRLRKEVTYALPGQGNGEVKELISIFSCRSFDGFLTLKMGDRRGPEAFKAHADAFRRLLEPVAPI